MVFRISLKMNKEKSPFWAIQCILYSFRAVLFIVHQMYLIRFHLSSIYTLHIKQLQSSLICQVKTLYTFLMGQNTRIIC